MHQNNWDYIGILVFFLFYSWDTYIYIYTILYIDIDIYIYNIYIYSRYPHAHIIHIGGIPKYSGLSIVSRHSDLVFLTQSDVFVPSHNW